VVGAQGLQWFVRSIWKKIRCHFVLESKRTWCHVTVRRGVCSGPWDVVCFIEHLCVSNLVKLLMILLGICQCIGRSFCKMCWVACETYWFALEDITCFLWQKLKNTKRVNHQRRHRFQDVELGYSSSDESDFSDNYHHLNLVRERRKDQLRGSLYPSTRHSSHSHNHHHVRLKTREVSVHVKGGSQRSKSLRHLQLSKLSSEMKVEDSKQRSSRRRANTEISFISSDRPSIERLSPTVYDFTDSGRTSRLSTSSDQSFQSIHLDAKFSDLSFLHDISSFSQESGRTSCSWSSQNLVKTFSS
ncbi:hypothetical protein CFP56_020575, partial [Quercus suber]